MKKLIPALCMLLVAACLMGTSTYAWFAANDAVTASGMKVQAISSGGLAIATSSTKNAIVDDDSAYKASIDATTQANMWTNGATQIAPVSKDIDGDWWTAKSNDASLSAAVAGSYTKAVENSVANGNTVDAGKGYFYHTQYSIKSLKQGATLPLYVSLVTVTGGTGNELDQAVRVAVECNGTWQFYAPNRASGTLNYYDAATSAPAAHSVIHFGETALTANDGGTNANVLANITYDTPVLVNVYLYYEGEDVNCKSQLATNITDLVLNLEFSAKAAS